MLPQVRAQTRIGMWGRPAVRSQSSGPSLLMDQDLVVDEGVAHEGCDGLVRGGGVAERSALLLNETKRRSGSRERSEYNFM